jgi:hypothetical protein
MRGLTLAIVDTEAHTLANNAIAQCVQRHPFDEVIVYSDRVDFWPQYRTVKIPVIRDIETYNHIVLEQLPEQLQTDHVLIAQYDGFVVDGKAWRDEFLQVDYLGAVWPQFTHLRVGNGGFSLRSRKLVEAAASLAHWRAAGEPEDVFIGRIARPALEMRHGCVFADEALAQAFSTEAAIAQPASFGFHGVMHLPVVYREALPFLVEHLPQRVLSGRLGLLAWGAKQLGAQREAEFWALVKARQAQPAAA